MRGGSGGDAALRECWTGTLTGTEIKYEGADGEEELGFV